MPMNWFLDSAEGIGGEIARHVVGGFDFVDVRGSRWSCRCRDIPRAFVPQPLRTVTLFHVVIGFDK